MEILQELGIDLHLLLVQIIGFGVLLWFLSKYVFTPIFAILDQRKADIQATYDQLDADRDAMVKTRKEYEERLAGIEAEARERIQAAVKEAQELRGNIIADAHKQGEALLEKARGEAERDRLKAFQEMRHEIVELAIGAAGKVIDEALDSGLHQKLVDDFIGAVGNGAIRS